MRLPTIPPDQLSAEQRPFYEDMRAEITRDFQGFKSFGPQEELIGPFNPGSRNRNSASRSGS